MATKKLHFETLQLHVGQEQPDSATDEENYSLATSNKIK